MAIWTVPAVQAQPKSMEGGIFTCVDASGRRLTSDRPIALCADREQRVLGASGVERRRIGPALTEVEMAQLLEERRLQQLQTQRLSEQRRRDAALLDRYPSAESHDVERRQSLAHFDELQRSAEKRLAELEAEHAEQAKELEFYAKDPSKAPVNLRLDLESAQRAEKEQQRFIERQMAEKQRIHQRFDTEKVRLQPMWDAQKRASIESQSSAEAR